MENRSYRWPTIAGAVLVSLSGCYGEEDDPPDAIDTLIKQHGRFLDVEGLAYESGSLKGATGAAGEFEYETKTHDCLGTYEDGCKDFRTNAPVSFHLMRDVPLWSGPVTSIKGYGPPCVNAYFGCNRVSYYVTRFMSPRTVSDDALIQGNVSLVLAMVDADANPDNGIQIPAAVREGTYGGGAVNWSSTDPRTDFAPLRNRVRELDPSGSHDWPATDDATVAHFDRVWNCAMTGRYVGSYGGIGAPKFIDTNGLSKSFDGKVYAIALPTGTIAGMSEFSTKPWQFDGVFRFSSTLQPGATATLPSLQYVDDGQLSPVANPQQTELQANILLEGSGWTTYTWNDGGNYSGDNATPRRYEMSLSPNPKGNAAEREEQPTNAVYRFGLYPIWLTTKGTGLSGDFREMYWQLDIDGSGKVWGSLVDIVDYPDTAPVTATLGASNGITMENTATSENKLPKPYEWRFDGQFDPLSVTLTGTWTAYDGTSIAWDATNPLDGCTTRGKVALP